MAKKRRNRPETRAGEDDRLNLKKIREVLSWIGEGAAAVLLAFCLYMGFGMRIQAADAAMDPEIPSGAYVLVNRLLYHISTPQRGDIVAFYIGGNEKTSPLVRRVAAAQGDTVQITGGILLVNGIPDGSAEDLGEIDYSGIAEQRISLQDGEYFVLGDNRSESQDSRSAEIGVVTEDEIAGKVWLVLPGEGISMHRVK